MNILLTILAGIAGAALCKKLHMPGGFLVGAIAGSAVFNIFFGRAFFPPEFKIATQTAAGAFIGLQIKKKDIAEFKGIILPSCIFFVGMVILGVGMGFVMQALTPLDLLTSLLACAPGGIVEMSLVGYDMGADVTKLVPLQLMRILISLSVMSVITKKIIGTSQKNGDAPDCPAQQAKAPAQELGTGEKARRTAMTCAVAAVFGGLGYLLKIPSGALTLSTIAVAAFGIFRGKAYLPMQIRYGAQISAGLLIGAPITVTDVLQYYELAIPVLLIILECAILNFGLGFLVIRLTRADQSTVLFGANPAGLSDMALIAHELGGDPPKVAVMQLIRYVGTLSVFPSLIATLCRLLPGL